MDVAPGLSTRGATTVPGEHDADVADPVASTSRRDRERDRYDESDPPRFAIEEIIGFAVLVTCVGVVLAAVHPNLLVLNTTPAGGDMGAHVWWPAFLRDNWFNHFRLAGWAPDWYAGFPVGQFYFPLPAILIDLFALVMPYNVAFKLITVSGTILLPIAAYQFGRALKFPWPTPPLFAIAVLKYVFETRHSALSAGNDAWTIYGGNLASTLAGEFSYVLGMALGLFFLASLARALETRKRLWIPAVLLAATVLCHIVIAAFAAVGGLAVWLTRKPLRTWKPAALIGAVGALVTAVWSVPLVVDTPYTQSMRYEKVTTFAIHLFGFRADQHHPLMPRPPWMWLLIAVAVLAAGWWRRTSTLVLIVMAVAFATFFRFWPEHSVWNTRYLPLYYFSLALLAAVGAAELIRIVASIGQRAYDWIREGDRLDALEREADAADNPADPWTGPEFDPVQHAWRRRIVGVGTLLAMLAALTVPTVWWVVDHEGVAPGWAQWNYEGYQRKTPSSGPDAGKSGASFHEFDTIMKTMNKLPPGRALWEPSDDINNYGTTLALELLPYFTHGRIDSMEGLYFESSATTDFHFMTVSELTAPGSASNPVRGLVYGDISDFNEGVEHLRMLGVRYFMAESADAKQHAAKSPGLKLVASVPDLDGVAPFGWKIYAVKGWNLAQSLQYEPVVVKTHGGGSSTCFATDPPPKGTRDPVLDPWECSAAPWWNTGDLSRPFAQSGPAGWAHASSVAAAEKLPARPLPKVTVGPVAEGVNAISFHVSRTGVPIVVKTSFFPNWKAHGAQGPWRLAPNLMVVIPTSHDVKLTYGETTGDRAGRLLTLAGVVGVVGLARYRPAPDTDPPGPSAPDATFTGWTPPPVPPAEPAPVEPPAVEPVGAVEPADAEADDTTERDGDGDGTRADPDENPGPDDEIPALP